MEANELWTYSEFPVSRRECRLFLVNLGEIVDLLLWVSALRESFVRS